MEWNRGHPIGHGSSATVSLATKSGGIFAVKSSELSQSKPLKREQRILSSLCSPYVITYKGCDITMENNTLLYNLFMEHMPFGTLVQETRRHGGRLDEPAIACYTRQVMLGLEYLHSNGLVHCDIKGANILIGEDGAKVCDFGCARSVNYAASVAPPPIGGTPIFMAPEVARGEEQGCPCDIWSLGCTVIEMATGALPWSNVANPVSVLYHIAYSGEVPEIPCFLSEQAKDFLGKCLRRNPRERWTTSQLLKHPFLVELCSNNKQVVESNSSSPTSILEQGFWSSVEESESLGNLIQKTCFRKSPAGRVRMLGLCSGEPCWAGHNDDDDENWITIRGNEGRGEVEAFDNCGSETASTSGVSALKELVKSNVSDRFSGHFCQDHNCRDASVVVSNLNFENGIAKMLLHSTLDFL
ncbi:mitogen-activated protein kinase kinase kinase 18-like [Gastrolobium bilobum]|uniref:mitogen-activated protein kinase kinase kinase 18-like n=1 Tax=Gastrolobium bilobum TaxID=150636 RepID=UPI002AB2410C|nr:mitogen-activated protein kinase kinase kinase 18-like [Gastrolobium bilobum]